MISSGLSQTSRQGYCFSSSHVLMWELDYKESWAPNNWCFWTVVLEKTLETPLDCKEIQSVQPKGNQSWIFIERTDAEAETQYFRHLMWRTDSFEKTLMLGKIEDRRRRGQQRMRWLASPTQWTWVWVNSGSWWWTGRPCVLQSIGVTKSRTLLSNWAELSQTCLWVFRSLLWSGSLASGQTKGREQSLTH